VVANALSDLTVTEDAADDTVDLSNAFNDVDDDNASITKSAVSSDTSLVTVSVSGDTALIGSWFDDDGGVDRGSVWVLFRAGQLSRPAADYTAVPRVALAPFQAVFQDLSTGDITSWFWDFGDGETSTLETRSPLSTRTGPSPVR